jgi:predicted acyltransferase
MKLAIVILILIPVFYLFGSFLAMSFNPDNWGIWVRAVLLIAYMGIIIYVDYSKDKD